ncbi:Integrase OS=Streptomyces fumanus OX=67302 GN=GCM10018772_70580 PE=4 SV=1 [Streptomyces fumanus]
MTTAEEYGTALEPVEVVDAELVEDDVPGAGEVAVHDPVAAVLAALDTKAVEDLYDRRPHKTKTGYARDWELWQEFHRWLEDQTGTRLPDSAITVGTYVAFVKWLDEVKEAAPNSIERRVTGVASEARRHGYEVPEGCPGGGHTGTPAARNSS